MEKSTFKIPVEQVRGKPFSSFDQEHFETTISPLNVTFCFSETSSAHPLSSHEQ